MNLNDQSTLTDNQHVSLTVPQPAHVSRLLIEACKMYSNSVVTVVVQICPKIFLFEQREYHRNFMNMKTSTLSGL